MLTRKTLVTSAAVAQTAGMNRRQDRRDDRQECRQQEGAGWREQTQLQTARTPAEVGPIDSWDLHRGEM